MPLLSFQHTPLTVAVSAHAASGLHQQATFTGLHLTIANQETTLTVQTRVDFLHPATQELIPGGNGLSSRPVPLTANNTCAVYFDAANPDDPRNGQILYWKRGLAPLDWGTVADDGTFTPLDGGLEAAPEPLLLQGQWVEALLLSMLAPLILQNMQQADQPPFSRFT